MLIVKNIQNTEFCEYSCEAKNEKCSAKLERGTYVKFLEKHFLSIKNFMIKKDDFYLFSAAPKQAAPAAPKSAMKSADKKKDEKKGA